MLTSSRFVVIDNDQPHLAAITDAFEQLGVGCLGIHYQEGHAWQKHQFAGLRVLVLDLHLTTNTKQSDDKPHYALIAGMLEEVIDGDAGPFIIVLWTAYPDDAKKLIAYLDANLEPHARPLTIIPLDKAPHLDTKTGSVRDPAKLREELTARIAANPQINALLSWEADVLAAASATLSSVMKLVPPEKRTDAAFSGELDGLLSQLAVAASGPSHVEGDIRGSINSVLAPVLLDRLNSLGTEDAEKAWAAAVTRYKAPAPLGDAALGTVNHMLHIETTGVVPTAWGAVLAMPDAWRGDKEATAIFGETFPSILKEGFTLKDADVEKCIPVLVRIGAACDYAQNKRGTIPLILGLQRPLGVKFDKMSDALWFSPVFAKDNTAFEVVTHSGYITTQSSKTVGEMTPLYRFREQLLMELINKVSSHIARPGKVYLGKINRT